MSWLLRYRIKLYLSNSLWVFPVISIGAGLIAVALLNQLERSLSLEASISVDTGRAVMSTVAGSMFTLMVVVSSALLVAVQLSGTQLTPRVITFVYRSRMRKIAMSVFVFTFTFSITVLARVDSSVPWLTGYLAAYGFMVNLALFLYMIDGLGKLLRPSSMFRGLAQAGRKVIRDVYPQKFDEKHIAAQQPIRVIAETTGRTIINDLDGVILAFDHKGLLRLAERADCLIEMVPAVGDFVAVGDPLFRVYENGNEIEDDRLQNSVAIGPERTLEQDPIYTFRVIVDIASRALSPAVNDPTTAVLAIDQIHHLLREVGTRYLAEGRETDRAGVVRLVYPTPDWEDFVHLAVTEIRQYGRDSIQVTRRMRAMLENLIDTLPERRAPLLRKQIELLATSASRAFPDQEDQLFAEASDLQGIGGSREGRKRDKSQLVETGSP